METSPSLSTRIITDKVYVPPTYNAYATYVLYTHTYVTIDTHLYFKIVSETLF